MSQITENRAAWINEKGARPFKVGPGPTPNPAENEVVIKVAYTAMNPVDVIVSSAHVVYFNCLNHEISLHMT